MSLSKDYLKLHFIVLIWGSTAVVGNLISIPAVEIVFYRTLMASLALLFFFLGGQHRLRVGWKAMMKMFGVGLLIGGHWILFFASSKVSTASVCLAGMATCSLWTSVVEPLLTRRRFQLFEVFLGLVIMAGLYIIFQVEFNHALGLVLALVSAFLSALFSVLNGQLSHKHDPYVITFYEMVGACAGTVAFFPFYRIYFTEGQELSLSLLPMDWVYIAFLALVCTVYAFSVSVELMRRLSVYAINLTINLEPIYGILLAVLVFKDKEEMNNGFYLGMFIILVSVLSYPLVNKYMNRKAMDIDNLR